MANSITVPFKNQLSEPNLDHIPDINADENCLPTCLASGMQFLLKVPFTGEEIQHAVYGRNYRGGTSAVEYVQWCTSHGVKLFSKSGNPGYLTTQIDFWLGQGCPVVGTIPSTYAPPQDRFNPGSSHCIEFYSINDKTIAAMNPWRAFSQVYNVSYWESIFCYGQVWVLQLAQKGKPVLNVPQGWSLSKDGQTLTAPNKHFLVHGFKDFVLAHDWHPDDQPLEEEHADGHQGTTLLCCNERLNWNSHAGVYVTSVGPEAMQSQVQLTAANATIQALKAQIAATPPPTVVPGEALKTLTDIDHTLASLIASLTPPKP